MPFTILRDDITRVEADAIVNSANPRPLIGSGTDSAIYRAAGWLKLLTARQKIGRIERGQAAATPAYRLKAKHIIHTVGPKWAGGNCGERETLRACYRNSLALAEELGADSIAFPLISSGVYGFPKDEALSIALDEIGSFLKTHDMMVKLIVFDPASFELSSRLMGQIEAYISDSESKDLLEEEYSGNFSRTLPYRRESSPFAPVSFEARARVAPTRPSRADKKPRRQMKRLPRENNPLPDTFPAPEINLPTDKTCEQTEEAKKRGAETPPEILPSRAEAGSFEAEEAEALSFKEKKEDKNAAFDEAEEESALSAAKEAVLFAGPSKSMVAEKAQADESLDELLKRTSKTFQQKLFELIDSRGLDDVTVYKKANVDRKLFSRIRCNEDYRPLRKTAVAFGIALELDLDTMEDLLARAGIAFSPSSVFDKIITFFVKQGNYDIFEINAALFKYGQPILGE